MTVINGRFPLHWGTLSGQAGWCVRRAAPYPLSGIRYERVPMNRHWWQRLHWRKIAKGKWGRITLAFVVAASVTGAPIQERFTPRTFLLFALVYILARFATDAAELAMKTRKANVANRAK